MQRLSTSQFVHACPDLFFGLFARHLVLLGEVIFVLALLTLRAGTSLRIPQLFWRERPRQQVVAGLSVALLLAILFLNGFLRDAAELPPYPASLQLYLACCFAMSACLGIGMSLAGGLRARINRAAVSPARSAHVVHWPLRLGFAGGAALALVLARGLDTFAGRPGPRSFELWLPSFLRTRGDFGTYHAAACCVALILVATNTALARGARHPESAQPALAICVFAALLGTGQSFLAARGWNSMEVLLLLGLLLVLAGTRPYKLRVRALASLYRPDMRRRLDAVDADRPRAAIPPGDRRQPKGPLVVVCAGGSGLQGAAWTGTVLSALEAAVPGFAYRTRLMTGASGGMLAASYYVATLRPPGGLSDPRVGWQHSVPLERFHRNLRGDVFSSVAQRTAAWDLPFSLLPFATSRHRGECLEDGWRKSMPELAHVTFGSIRKREQEGWCPTLLFAPVFAEDGRRLVISNDQGSRLEGAGERGPVDFSRLFPDALNDLPLTTAARLGAALPLIGPGEALPTTPRRRVVAAEYADATGVQLAADWLQSFIERSGAALTAEFSGILLVRIGVRPPRPSSGSWLTRGFEEISTPVTALLAARSAAMEEQAERRLSELHRIAAPFGSTFLSIVTFDLPHPTCVSWALDSDELRAIDEAIHREHVVRALLEVQAWWESRMGGARATPKASVGS